MVTQFHLEQLAKVFYTSILPIVFFNSFSSFKLFVLTSLIDGFTSHSLNNVHLHFALGKSHSNTNPQQNQRLNPSIARYAATKLTGECLRNFELGSRGVIKGAQ